MKTFFELTLLFSLCALCGCNTGEMTDRSEPPTQQVNYSNAEFGQSLDEVLNSTYSDRQLNTDDHAAWQILHGVLTYKQGFQVAHRQGSVSAVDHVLRGGHMEGWTMERGNFGPRAILEPGTKTGQGHADQWLAVLAQCGLSAEHPIEVRGTRYTMGDWVHQVQYDVPRNAHREYSWTLIGLTLYLPTDSTWIASDGQEWSIERLVRIEAEQDLDASACGGTHRLIGMSMALNQHMAQGGEISGAWQLAEEKIMNAIELVRKYQNPNGSLSTKYLQRPASSADLAKNLSTTGHTLEFLTISLTNAQLREGWVQRAAWYLSDVFRKTADFDLECGGLYHAAHGLALYRERVFGAADSMHAPTVATDTNTAPRPPEDLHGPT